MIYSYSVILIVLWKFTPREFTCLSLVQRKLVFSASEPTRFHPKSLLLFLPPPPPHFALSYKLHACQFSIHFGYFISHILRKRLYVSTSRQKAHRILYKPSETSE